MRQVTGLLLEMLPQLYRFCLLPAGQTETTEPEVLFKFCSPVLPLLLSEGAAVAVGHLLPLLDVRGGRGQDELTIVNPHHVGLTGVIEHGHGRTDHLPDGGGGVAGHQVEAIKAASLVSVELGHTEQVVQGRGLR